MGRTKAKKGGALGSKGAGVAKKSKTGNVGVKVKGGGCLGRRKKTDGGGKGGGKGAHDPGGGAGRKETRGAHRRMHKLEQGTRRHHGGVVAVEETRRRLKLKALERQVERSSSTPPAAERCKLLQELGSLFVEDGKHRQAVTAFEEVLKFNESDPDFVRTPLLRSFMEQAKGVEARKLVEGPLFAALCTPGEEDTSASDTQRAARITGLYSQALLDYISVRVLREEKKKAKIEKSEARLAAKFKRAHEANPFVAEYLAFAPAFEVLFPMNCDLPPASACVPGERPLLDALDYCCRFRQAGVWLETDEDVRKYFREVLFEAEPEEGGDDKPPFAALPTEGGQAGLTERWAKSREESLALWGEEMSADGHSDAGEGMAGEEGGEEEDAEGDSEEEASEAASDAFAKLEKDGGF